MNTEKRLLELELKGYSLKFSPITEGGYIHCWFKYEKYADMSDEDCKIYDATFSSSNYGDKFRITFDALRKLESYFEQYNKS